MDGPLVTACPSCDAATLPRNRDGLPDVAAACMSLSTPLVVRRFAADRAASDAWSFTALARLCDDVSAAAQVGAQNGLIEQGPTMRKAYIRPGNYLRDMAADRARAQSLLKPEQAHALAAGRPVPLNWDAIRAASGPEAPRTTYLAHWDMFQHLAGVQAGVTREWATMARAVWGRWTSQFAFSWIGPADTLTGLHYDLPDNMFIQMRGDKEMVLFPSDQRPLLPIACKYDPGAHLACLDVTRLHEQGDTEVVRKFRQARGWYVKLEPGDCLFIPRKTYHLVHSLSPSLSISSFGHSPFGLVTNGLWIETLDALHRAGLYGWGHCSCHGAGEKRPWTGPAALATLAALAGVALNRWIASE
jgi:hypothetical protein